MKVVIVNEKTNPHMKRREIVATVEHISGATPSRAGLQHLLAKQLGIDVQQVDIKKIFSSTGKQQSRLAVHVWDEKRIEDLAAKAAKEKKEEKTEGKKE
ncbi:MAG: hypothetical protein HZB67_04360 [Candidatus Aenigmarchaeota archaeon]|nr:hypothetical protein [Candidatus Aenigmarchaeota archaeon]